MTNLNPLQIEKNFCDGTPSDSKIKRIDNYIGKQTKLPMEEEAALLAKRKKYVALRKEYLITYSNMHYLDECGTEEAPICDGQKKCNLEK